MTPDDLSLIDNTLLFPDLSADNRYNGPLGVERWISDIVAHCVRCEQVINQNGYALDVNFSKVSRFLVTTKSAEYSAQRNTVPIDVEFAVHMPVDFSGLGLVEIPPPPAPAPTITGVTPPSGGQDQIFTVTGTRLAGVESVQLIPQMLGGSPIPGNILSQTETEITCQFIFSGSGPIRLNYSGGHIDSTDFIDNGA